MVKNGLQSSRRTGGTSRLHRAFFTFHVNYDPAALVRLNTDIAALAARTGVSVLPVPPLEDFTIDGVHFTPEVSARYMAALAAPD